MSVEPDAKDDGPVTVYCDDQTYTFDRIRHLTSGMVRLYDVHEYQDGSSNRIAKGTRAKTIPVHRIVEIQYENMGE